MRCINALPIKNRAVNKKVSSPVFLLARLISRASLVNADTRS
jgi:hypothetical protein